ncbi:LANO_0H15170g1_1 [Lachancea nothofagi CBS 11611]|uniref:non-specific serine/threonine protein kinase n=1 Tax=Lachancea nothofagi CBS 11611 TaxID=1266666 RepID=A0A1G4KMJ4_9SACH|nr:LANO_0H15170g1_1 [Lachancea nothofagi CBS 11611]
MTSVPQRHTYYGAPSSAYTQSRQSAAFGTPKRKHVTFGPYIVGSTLGEGEFGKVKLGWSKTSGSSLDVPKQVAIKLVRRDTIPKNSEKEVKIYREINALKHLNHPNIVKLEEVLQNSKYIGIVLEYASGGEFYKYIQKKRRLKEGAACRLFAQLVSGVCYMHSKGLVHRDLKLENLLLDKQENLLITDFGFVNEFSPEDELMKTSCGSPCYAAPELVVTTKPYEARKADLWSCGVILYAMLAGYLPWDDDIDNPDGDDIGKLYRYITRTPLKFPEYITPVPRDLLRDTLVPDPKRRISIDKILQHRWLQAHRAFLSVTPEEWDHVSRNKDILRRPPPKKDASDSARPRSNCSVSSSNSKGEKRDSLIMDSSLYSQPVPPHQSQSHAVAMPSSPSPRLRQSPVKGARHSRSNSAASVALQAVVDAEKEFHATHVSFPTSASTSALQSESSPPGSQNPSPRLYSYALTKPSQNTISSLRDSVIIETSPQKGSAAFLLSVPQIDASTGLIVPSSSGNSAIPHVNTGYKTSHSANNHTNHNLSQHRRPRPTSYHPTSYTAFNDKSFTNQSPTLSEINTMEVTPLKNEGATSVEKTSPQLIQKDSFTLSKPFVDMQIVAGDLIKTGDDGNTVTKKIHDQVEDADNRLDVSRQRRQSQRYSVVYDKLFGAVAEQSEDTAVADDREATMSPEPLTDVVQDSKKITASPSVKKEKKRFSIMSVYSSYNASKSSIESVNPKFETKDKDTSTNDYEKRSRVSSSRHSSAAKERSTTDADTRIKTQRNSSKASKSEAQVERQPSSKVTDSANSHTKGSQAIQTEVQVERQPSTKAPNSTNIQRISSLRKTSKNPPTKKKPNRSSVMVSSIPNSDSAGSTTTDIRPREQSTAKKVMDFFKRRSMRL